MIRDEAETENADQYQHFPAALRESLEAGGCRLLLLSLRQPTGGAVVEKDHGEEDKEEDGGRAGVDDFVEHADLMAVQGIAVQHTGDKGQMFWGEQSHTDVGACHGQQ